MKGEKMRTLNRGKIEELILQKNIQEVFIDHLGWDSADGKKPLSFDVKEENEIYSFRVEPVSQKRKFWVCNVFCDGDNMPPEKARNKLQRMVTASYGEHLLVFYDSEGGQKWRVSIKRKNKPRSRVEVSLKAGQRPNLLMEKLNGLVFHLKDEKNLFITGVTLKIEDVFGKNAEKVTRKFYKEFRKKFNQFHDFIKNIQSQVDREQYTALMLNRLMFVFFIQSKGFLGGNSRYLQYHFDEHKKHKLQNGDSFYISFYRHFIITLFHSGLGAPTELRNQEIQEQIGEVPYLNGGLFDVHELERQYQIDIDDSAFQNIFDFFEKYNWHLDERATATGRDINPDVIGYIFEKYINGRASKGAYYTQEDITCHIARNTILPHLLRRARDNCREAFHPETGTIWTLLRNNPDDYIYEAMQKGGNITEEEIPENIRVGINTSGGDLLQRRKEWNTPADEKYALKGETWREMFTRQARYKALRDKIKKGEICEINDLITYNLDIEQLTEDMLNHHEGADLISAFFHAIAGRKTMGTDVKEQRGITVLDPACGSGAFVFAALNVLQPLYAICIERMRDFVKETPADKHKDSIRHEYFRHILTEADSHVSDEYWIYRSIILNNLFGVDIMPEATEVAKLRLFLKLAAVAEKDDKKPNMGLEPLPDIDFNIRTGNALVGFSNEDEFAHIVENEIDFSGLIQSIKGKAKSVGAAYLDFVNSQAVSDIDTVDFKRKKADLHKQLTDLNSQLDKYLAQEYYCDKEEKFGEWKESHRPFHWLSEFYEIIAGGGFDVIIGNPPYVETSKTEYQLINFLKAKGNLYSFFLEKATQLLAAESDIGMIVPISLPSTKRMQATRELLVQKIPSLYTANFADRPGTLFTGVHQKLTIILGNTEKQGFYTTNFMHWFGGKTNERENLFTCLHYYKSPSSFRVWQKFGNNIEKRIWNKMQEAPRNLTFIRSPAPAQNCFFVNKRLMYWVKCFISPKESKEFRAHYAIKSSPAVFVALFNSSTFFWCWETVGDGWDLTQSETSAFCFGIKKADYQELCKLGETLERDLENKKKYVGTVQTEYEYYHRLSKDIIDKIDQLLTKHYGLTEEETDYVINYNHKYRMSGGDKQQTDDDLK